MGRGESPSTVQDSAHTISVGTGEIKDEVNARSNVHRGVNRYGQGPNSHELKDSQEQS